MQKHLCLCSSSDSRGTHISVSISAPCKLVANSLIHFLGGMHLHSWKIPDTLSNELLCYHVSIPWLWPTKTGGVYNRIENISLLEEFLTKWSMPNACRFSSTRTTTNSVYVYAMRFFIQIAMASCISAISYNISWRTKPVNIKLKQLLRGKKKHYYHLETI